MLCHSFCQARYRSNLFRCSAPILGLDHFGQQESELTIDRDLYVALRRT
jgi:hypothetical protein